MKIDSRLKYFTIIFTVLFILLAASGTINTGIVLGSLTNGLSAIVGGTGGIPASITSITAFNSITANSGNPITLISNDSELSSISFRANVLVGTGGNEVLTANSIGNGTGISNLTVQKNASFAITYIDDTYSYPIMNDNQPVSTYVYSSFTTLNPWETCGARGEWTISSGLFGTTKYCVKKNQIAVIGHLGSANYNSKVTVKANILTTGGSIEKSSEVILDNVSNKTKEFRDSSSNYFGYVQYLSTGNTHFTTPSVSTAIIYKKVGVNTWEIGGNNKSVYDLYVSQKTYLENQLNYLQTNGFNNSINWNLGLFGVPIASCTFTNCEQYLDDLVNATTNNANKIVVKTQIPYSNAPTYQSWNNNSSDSGTYKIALSGDIWQYPQLLFSINASSMGITISTAKPQLNGGANPSKIEYTVGDYTPKTYSFNVTSVGGDGCYKATFDSCNIFSVSSAPTLCIAKGLSGNIKLSVVPSVQNPQSNVSCTVRIYETSKPSNFVTTVVQGTIKQSTNCSPGAYEVRSNQIWKCKSDGTAFELSSNCQYGISYDAQNNPVCNAAPGLCGNGALDAGEDCDGSNLNGKTCLLLGLGNGALNCGSTCHFNSAQCIIDPPFVCAVGEHLVVSDTPVWWSLGLIKETKTYCEKDFNYALVVLIIVAGMSVVAVALIFKGKKKGRR